MSPHHLAHTASTDRSGVPRLEALARVCGLYLVVQILSYVCLQRACSAYVLGELWIYGALGPFAAVTAIPRFQYHSLLSNFGFVLVCLTVLASPFAYVAQPRRSTLIVSAVALVIWCVFGLGFSIDHM
jgi:hypothetical protein